MFRYIAAVWEPSSEGQRTAVTQIEKSIRADSEAWCAVLSAPGLRVYCAGVRRGSSEVHALHGRLGVVLGTVFTRVDDEGTPAKAVFGPKETAMILQTEGRELIDQYWGRYVAFLCNSTDRSVLVVRSPTGENDCLCSTVLGVRIYFSATEHCPPLGLTKISINWDYVAATISTLVQETRETGLRDIERVLHGECVKIQKGSAERRSYWSPIRFIKDAPIEDPTRAALALHNTVRKCVYAWASCYESILAMVSGGLDSSIILSLLRDAPSRPMVTCVNYHNIYDCISDERSYARTVARHLGYSLFEHEHRTLFSLEPLRQIPRLVAPWLFAYEVGHARDRRELARAHQAQAYFQGVGGDELFFSGAGDYTCADFVHRHGLHPKLISIALDAARMTDGALWPTLRQGVRDGFRRDCLAPVSGLYNLSPLLRPEVAEVVRRKRLFIPPWLDGAQRIPPGKCWQVLALSRQEDTCSPYGHEDEPEIVNPLLSQPVQELCFRIPTYTLAFGGTDRGLARLAFKQALPPEILTRRTKGGVADYGKAILTSNLPFLRDLLLDGVLVKEGLVDRHKLEKTLSGDFSKGLVHAHVVLTVASAEAWARNWIDSRIRMVA